MYALTTTLATGGEERERHRAIKCMRSPHTATGGEERETIKCMRSPHPATGGEEKESHRANEVFGHTI